MFLRVSCLAGRIDCLRYLQVIVTSFFIGLIFLEGSFREYFCRIIVFGVFLLPAALYVLKLC